MSKYVGMIIVIAIGAFTMHSFESNVSQMTMYDIGFAFGALTMGVMSVLSRK